MFTLCLASMLFAVKSKDNCHSIVESTYRWILLSTNLQQPENTDKALKAVDAAASAGYNGVVFQDSSLNSLRTMTPAYHSALISVMGETKKQNLEFIPLLSLSGGTQDILGHDRSLAESMPYKGVRFLVTNGQLKPSDPPIVIPNGGLDAFTGELPTSFKGSHSSDIALFNDTAVHHGGASSFRLEGQPSSQAGKGGLTLEQAVPLRPWHQYRVTLWTKGTDAAGSVVTINLRSPSGQLLGTGLWQNTPDWSRNDVVFDSMADAPTTISIVVQPIPGAKIWLDDLTIQDVGTLNITQREDCPVVVTGDDGAIYNEGIDVTPFVDGFHPAGASPSTFDVIHDAPLSSVLSNSRLHEGQTVLVDFYAASIVNGAPSLCVNAAKSKAHMKANIRRVFALMHPHFVFLSAEDGRSLGWDPACEGASVNSGDMLASLIRSNSEFVKSLDKSIRIVTFNGMFDPFQNSKDEFLMMRGGVSGSAKGLPKGTIIANCNFSNATDSLTFFSQQGFNQILWGFYDNANGAIPIAQWKNSAIGVKGIQGYGYVTLTDDYSHVVDFAKAASGSFP